MKQIYDYCQNMQMVFCKFAGEIKLTMGIVIKRGQYKTVIKLPSKEDYIIGRKNKKISHGWSKFYIFDHRNNGFSFNGKTYGQNLTRVIKSKSDTMTILKYILNILMCLLSIFVAMEALGSLVDPMSLTYQAGQSTIPHFPVYFTIPCVIVSIVSFFRFSDKLLPIPKL